jgi:hypothetical protein
MTKNSFLIPDRNDDDHDKYLLKKGDTFESVAEELGIEWRLLRSFHNANCFADADVINKGFPSHLKFLLLKPIKLKANGEPEDIPPEKVIFSSQDFEIPFRPAHTDSKYGVIYFIENGKEVQTIKQEINVKWLSTNENGYSFLEINRISKLYINDIEADCIGEELAEKASSFLYPLQIVVDQEGQWLDIYDFENIKNRWESKKREILEEYEGGTTKKYVAIVDEILENRSSLSKSISSDLFIRSFFNEIHVPYTEKLTFERDVYFPVISKSEELKYRVQQKVSPYLNDFNLVTIEQEGTLEDPRTKANFEEKSNFNCDISNLNQEKATGKYKARYFLNPNNYKLETLFFECSINLDVPKKITVMIFDQSEKRVLTIASRESLFIETAEKQKGIFGVFKEVVSEMFT